MDSNNMYQNQQPEQNPDNNQSGNQGGYYQNIYTQTDNNQNPYTQGADNQNPYTQGVNNQNSYTQGANSQNTYTNANPNPNANPSYQYNPYNNGYQSTYQPMQGDLEEPISMGEWAVTRLIRLVPCLGLIMMFVWAFGSDTKKSKSNFFKVELIYVAITTVFWILFTIWMVNAIIEGNGGYMYYRY